MTHTILIELIGHEIEKFGHQNIATHNVWTMGNHAWRIYATTTRKAIIKQSTSGISAWFSDLSFDPLLIALAGDRPLQNVHFEHHNPSDPNFSITEFVQDIIYWLGPINTTVPHSNN